MNFRDLLRLVTLCAVFAPALAGSVATAQAATTVGDTRVVIEAVSGTLEANIRDLAVLDDVFHRELIATAADSATEITFLDGTVLTIGENSTLTLTEIIFDPTPGNARMIIDATLGVFKFASGNLPKESYEIRTPVATIGIRGTILSLVVEADGTTTVTADEGIVSVSNRAGVVRTLGLPGSSTIVLPAVGAAVPAPTAVAPAPAAAIARVRVMTARVAQARGTAADAALGGAAGSTAGSTALAGATVRAPAVAGGAGAADGAAGLGGDVTASESAAGDDGGSTRTGSTDSGGNGGEFSLAANDGGTSGTGGTGSSGGGSIGGSGSGSGGSTGSSQGSSLGGSGSSRSATIEKLGLLDYKVEIGILSLVLAFFLQLELRGKKSGSSAGGWLTSYLMALLIVWLFFGFLLGLLAVLNATGVTRISIT